MCNFGMSSSKPNQLPETYTIIRVERTNSHMSSYSSKCQVGIYQYMYTDIVYSSQDEHKRASSYNSLTQWGLVTRDTCIRQWSGIFPSSGMALFYLTECCLTRKDIPGEMLITIDRLKMLIYRLLTAKLYPVKVVFPNEQIYWDMRMKKKSKMKPEM